MYPRYILLLVFAYHVVTGRSSPATYDQRQSGDVNVQVHLKDVQVLALLDSELLDDYTEYDYFYDYADFTVKPIVKPTTSTTTTTEASSALEVTEKVDVSEVSDSLSQNSTSPPNSESLTANSTVTENTEVPSSLDTERNETLATLLSENLENVVKTRINDKNRNLFENEEEDPTKRSDGSTENPSRRVTRKRCRSGYSPDGKGRCRRMSQRRLSLIPLAMKLAPKFLDDLARSNLVQKEVDQMHSSRSVP